MAEASVTAYITTPETRMLVKLARHMPSSQVRVALAPNNIIRNRLTLAMLP
jgi:hypothetical protein